MLGRPRLNCELPKVAPLTASSRSCISLLVSVPVLSLNT